LYWVGSGWASQLMGWVGSGHTVWTHGQLCSLYSGTHYWCIRVRSATEQRSVLEFASATTRPHFPPGTVCPLYLRQFILFPSVVLRGSIFDVLLTPARLAGGRPTLRLPAYTPAVLIMSLSVVYVLVCLLVLLLLWHPRPGLFARWCASQSVGIAHRLSKWFFTSKKVAHTRLPSVGFRS